MNLTPSQEAAVRHRGSSLLVSASAGSGKTEVLARRCVDLIADAEQPCRVEQLLVVTFTRAAAAELRVRVGRMLRAEAAKVRDTALRDHLRRQEVLVDAADIGTIDAWCGRVLRAHAAEAGVDAEFTVLGEEDARLLRREVLDELFAWIYVAEDETALAAREWLTRHSRPADDFLRRLVADLHGFRESLVDVEAWLARQREICSREDEALVADARLVLAEDLRRECVFQAEQLGTLLADSSREGLGGLLGPLQAALADWAQRLNRAAELPGVVKEIAKRKLGKARDLAAADQALFEQVRDRWLKKRLQGRWVLEDVQRMLDVAPQCARLTRTLLDLEWHYHERLTAAKQARAACEFGDVLRLTLDLLGETAGDGARWPSAIALRLRQRYEHVLVDEYQDTSPVQAEILRLVARDEPARANRFLVGDVKQSIYGFRQADPRLFAALAQAFVDGSAEGCVQPLSDNFRSHPALLAALNDVFAQLLHPRLGGTAFGEEERLRAGRQELPNPTLDGRPRVEIHLCNISGAEPQIVDDDDDDVVPVERIEREAALCAGMIRDLLADGVQVPERGADDTLHLRPLRLGDVVILLRSARQNAAAVASVLRQAGIPAITSGRDALFDVPEVMDLRNVLSLLANRRQDVPLAAYLRGPLVGLSAAELLRVRNASPDTDFHDAVASLCRWPDDDEPPAAGDDDELVVRLRAALAQLARWRRAAREEELSDLARHILHDTGLLLFAAGLPGGAHRAALLRAVEGFAADFARSGQHGVAEFVAYLDDLATAEFELGLPVAAGADAVRIMTIHAAKGLEFPIVFLLNTGGRFNRRRLADPVQADAEHGPGLRFFDYPSRVDLAGARHEVIRHTVAQRELEEELRLLYVAMTRARERLIVCGHAGADAWERAQQASGAAEAPPALASRLTVACSLEWLLMAAAGSGLCMARDGAAPLATVYAHADAVSAPPPEAEEKGNAAPVWTADDDAWLQRGQSLLAAEVDTSLAAKPAVLSVSAVKELAQAAAEADTPWYFDVLGATAGGASKKGTGTSRRASSDTRVSSGLGASPVFQHALSRPAFAAPREEGGRTLGLACHRFLECADLARLATAAQISEQAAALVTAGRLTADEAARLPVEDLAWLGASDAGRLLAEHGAAAQRELPFVVALRVDERGNATIVRGVIDCLLDTPAGLTLLDYKTDRIADEDALEQRVRGYAVQMQLYAAAIERLFNRPVTQALLVFLTARRIVPVAGPAPDLAQLLAT
ncbi:MAG: UvrD-helicase domain-containing protein [Phycisphaerae bacterium]|jgi:ATP-dependent helicase/nuclease subunit A